MSNLLPSSSRRRVYELEAKCAFRGYRHRTRGFWARLVRTKLGGGPRRHGGHESFQHVPDEIGIGDIGQSGFSADADADGSFRPLEHDVHGNRIPGGHTTIGSAGRG